MATLKSDILSIYDLLGTNLPEGLKCLKDELSRTKDSTIATQLNNIQSFLVQQSVSTDTLKEKLNQINKESKSLSTIFEHCQFQTKEQAISTLYETLGLIEVLWNLMISYETTVLLKESNKFKSRLFDSCNLSKSFSNFFRTRSLSYTKMLQCLSNSQPDQKGVKNDYYNFLINCDSLGTHK